METAGNTVNEIGHATNTGPASLRGPYSLPYVGDTGIEPVASSVSRKRSPTELIAPTLR